MPIEPGYEKFSAREKVGKVNSQIKIECKTDVSAESVEKILNENALATVTMGETTAGRAEFTGKATFFICYTVNGEIKKTECGAEIKDSFNSEIITAGDKLKPVWSVDRIEIDLSGLKMSVSAYLTVNAEVFRKAEYTGLNGGNGVFCDFVPVKTVKSFGIVNSVYQAEEEFELPFNVEEVLSHRAEACVTSVQCGVGTIVCDGEIYLSEILLQSGEKKDIIRDNKVLTFRAEIESEDAMPQTSATCRVWVKSLKTDIGVDEEKNTSTVTVKVTLGLLGEAFSITEQTLAVDAFAIENQLLLKKEKFNPAVESEPVGAYAKVTERATVEDFGGARLIAVVSEKAQTAECVLGDGKINVTGAVTVNALFYDEEGKVFSRKAEIPFDTSFPYEGEGKVEVIATAKSASARAVNNTELDCDAEITFTVYCEREFSAEFISDIEMGEEKPEEDSAVSVYIPLEGEGLWELSKRLNVCPETVVSTNADLQFPLTGKERIVVYRQK